MVTPKDTKSIAVGSGYLFIKVTHIKDIAIGIINMPKGGVFVASE